MKEVMEMIENAQARGSKISSIERIGDDFVAIYMYNQHGVFTLIQYADNILNMIHTPAGSIKRLYDDWEASQCDTEAESSE